MLTSAFATAVAVAACSGGAHKKAGPAPGDAGAAGEAGAPPDETGGKGGTSGTGGTDVSSAGEGGASAAGAPAEAGAAGEAGSGMVPLEPPPLHVLFTVGAGATGLAGSALADQANPSNVIFGSNTENPDAISGTNEVVFTGAELGLAANDTIDAFAIAQPVPQSPVYLFSVAGDAGERGLRSTRLNRSSLEDGAPGDVYFSDGSQSFRWGQGETGDTVGYNGLLADEQSLGLSPAPPKKGALDDLTGVQVLRDGALPSELYFSVSRESLGLKNSAVADTVLEERGCTIYKSALDGTNTVAFSCAALGIAVNSDVKGLTVYGLRKPTEVLFTVDATSTGIQKTPPPAAAATAAVITNGASLATALYPANNVYASPGDGSNSTRVTGVALGLINSPQTMGGAVDAIDALAVVDRAPAAYGLATTCNLTPSPLSDISTAGANLSTFNSAHGLGDHLILVSGPAPLPAGVPVDTAISAVGAYNVETCAFVARAEITANALQGRSWVPVPLAGWTATAPLKKLEYWALSDNSEIQLLAQRINAAGDVVSSYLLTDVPVSGFRAYSLEYDPANDRLIGVVGSKTVGNAYERVVFARPPIATPDGTALLVLRTPLPHPCANAPTFSGVDAKGNSYFGQYGNYYDPVRICPLTPTGEFLDLPFSVLITQGISNWGMVVPGTAIHALYENNGFLLAHQALGTPPL